MLALIDYNMGNLASVHKALEKAGAAVRIVDQAGDLAAFDGCILPGVGNFGDGMENLRRGGMAEAIKKFIASGKPFAGICLGMQMLLDSSEEAPGVAGLGVIPGVVRRFPAGRGKIPHMGWNSVRKVNPSFGTIGLADDSYFYFVHSYYALPAAPAAILLECDYIFPFAAAIGGGNIFATQFHPEKSHTNGLQLLTNFVRYADAGKINQN